MRKLTSISVALFVLAGVMTALPASAATISNGVSCKKLNQTTKVGSRKYKCAKNPLLTSAKLTWLSNDCLLSANSFVRVRRDSVAISEKYAAQIPVIDLGIVNEDANKAEIQLKLDESNLRLAAAEVKLAAAKTDAEKKSLTAAVGSWKSAVRAYTSKLNSIISNIRTLEAAKTLASSQPTRLAASIAGSKSTAQLICTKGL